jgi:thiosulfate/3-mercaptopyruvate sulfurtransferase
MNDALIDCATLAQHLDDPAWAVVDCRFDLADTNAGERAYREAHIPGARYAHMDTVLSGPITPDSGRHPLPAPDALCRWLGEQGIGNASQVVVYDHSGGAMAVRLWWLLRWLGHEQVALLDGGWPAWLSAGLPTEATSPRLAAKAFSGTPHHDMLLSTQQIVDDLDSGRWLLIDARTAERYRGEHEPIDPVAGRIPGSLNLPLQQHLNADGTFKSAQQLREMYLPLIGNHPLPQVAALCGSGVTACHNLLALHIAGLHGARLYAGSWSEWIRDPERPVATG